MRLQNKITVITGAGHGIGKAYAQWFAAEGKPVFSFPRRSGFVPISR